MIDTTPTIPHDLEAEAALLGSLILDAEQALPDVAAIVTADDFYRPAHGAIYGVIADLHGQGRPVDMVALNGRLRDRDTLDEVGGLDYLVELAESVPSATSAAHYARRVHEKADLRRLIAHAEQAIRAAQSSTDPADVAGRLSDQLASLGGSDSEAGTHSLGDDLGAIYSDLEHWQEHGRPEHIGLSTGLASLDHQLGGGLAPGTVTVVAAGTGQGKTALALSIASHAAMHQSAPVGIFSLEMTHKQMAQRLYAAESGVALSAIRGQTTPRTDEWERLAQAAGRCASLPLYAVDERDLTPSRLRARAKWLHARKGIRLLIIDYLQLMRGERRENRNLEVAEISRAITLLSLELDIPIIALSQLNRDSSREARRPRLSDLRDSGSIEQDATSVIFLHDESRSTEPPQAGYIPGPRQIELIVAKNRQGPTGSAFVQFDGARQRFSELRIDSQTA